jgi:pyridoxine 5-phosphate synthase
VLSAYEKLATAGIAVSLFIDPSEAQIDAAAKIGAPVIELHTGRYAEARQSELQLQELQRIRQAAYYADKAGLQVNAGHGLDCYNVAAICAIPEIVELNIGYSIIAQALFSGLAESVRHLKHIMHSARLHAN